MESLLPLSRSKESEFYSVIKNNYFCVFAYFRFGKTDVFFPTDLCWGTPARSLPTVCVQLHIVALNIPTVCVQLHIVALNISTKVTLR